MTRYGSAAAFHQALEERLKKQPGAHQVKRNLLAIQRLLWRLSMVNEDVIVKGGIALRLRSERARTTSDLDLRLGGDRARLEATLRSAVQTPAGDFMSWEFAWTKALEAVDGQRFRVQCAIGGRPFSSFDVDFAPPEPLVGEVERVVGADWLSFSGVPTPDFRVYPLTTQLAEKLHAYTRPRDQTNTRVKDLPDIVLIGTLSDGLRRSELVEALRRTFDHRQTHRVPRRFESPPETWRWPYEKLVSLSALPWASLDEAFRLASRFVQPALDGDGDARWDAARWTWKDTLSNG